MKSKYEIILSGVGGQGLITCGSILGEAAVVHEGLNASLTSSYGVETRGTFTKSDIIISRDEIYYPEVQKADVILALAPAAYNRYVSAADSDTLLIYDSDLVTELKESKAPQYGYPFMTIARELGSDKAANIVALGVIIAKTGVLSREAVLKVFDDIFSGREKIRQLNLSAFERGWEIADTLPAAIRK